jgi:hypothetical protein
MPCRRPALRRALALVALSALGLGVLGACGDDEKGSGTTTTLSPEDVKAPMSEVLAGLPQMVVLGNKAASEGQVGAFDDADDETGKIEDVWKTIEGTVKDTDIDTYEKIETAQGLIKDGAKAHNAERIQQGAQDQSDAVDAFIAGHG